MATLNIARFSIANRVRRIFLRLISQIKLANVELSL